MACDSVCKLLYANVLFQCSPVVGVRMISGFRCGVNDVFAVLFRYDRTVRSSGVKQSDKFLDCLNLEDQTVRLYRNVGK